MKVVGTEVSPLPQLHGGGGAQDPTLLLLHLHGAHQHFGLPEGAEAQMRVSGQRMQPERGGGTTCDEHAKHTRVARVSRLAPVADGVPSSVPARRCCRWPRTSSPTWVGARCSSAGRRACVEHACACTRCWVHPAYGCARVAAHAAAGRYTRASTPLRRMLRCGRRGRVSARCAPHLRVRTCMRVHARADVHTRSNACTHMQMHMYIHTRAGA